MEKIGSELYRKEWKKQLKLSNSKKILENLLDQVGMPDDLSGELAENQRLVAQFDGDLAPHDPFWKDLARLVRRVMKTADFREKTVFNRRIHQLRYVISSQQAQYVRQHYRKDGMSDQEALMSYLKDNHLRPRIYDNARLHNKRKFEDGQFHFPDQEESYNFKVLLGTRTEFILDSKGRFLNEVDAEEVRDNGIINGASFNYGNTPWRHVRLDVLPIGVHDPAFRKKIAKPYKNPNQLGKIRLARFWKERRNPDFECSFYNKTGGYARSGDSLAKLVKGAKKDFKRTYRQSKNKKSQK